MVIMSKVEIRPIDAQGRIILPKAWRNRLRTGSVVVVDEEDRLEIRPADTDLSRFVDAVSIDADNFGDYHKLRKGLRKDAVR
ncbi:MAG: AbrB/MazE/SpoVT family DNA-binding domain-containing protein [Methanoregula sp.]|nr:AbrB/MazE/SpoVT family DNA-binding domain-containing protein [Methanoregula sp.]